jgi:hypothetical protein
MCALMSPSFAALLRVAGRLLWRHAFTRKAVFDEDRRLFDMVFRPQEAALVVTSACMFIV